MKYGYQLCQSFLRIKDSISYEEKSNLFKHWLSEALGSILKTFESADQALLKWNKEILNFFHISYINSSIKDKNNKIKVIKNGFGYRKLSTLKHLIMLKDCKS